MMNTSPEGMRLRVVPAAQLTADQLAQLTVVYEQAFPPHLRVPLAELAAPAERDRLYAAVAGTAAGAVVGFASARLLRSVPWVFLRYYGIAVNRRRTGLGRRFWNQLRQVVIASGWPADIAFEVEDPGDARDDAVEQQVRRDRISFWTSCGAREVSVPGYVMPALTSIGVPEPMRLMVAVPDGRDLSEAGELAALVQAIFTEHYGLTPAHPLLAAAVESIGP
jgi:hypothetical protein